MSLSLSSEIDALNNSTLVAWLRHYAVDTWERIAFSRNSDRNSIFETTLTQNLVYNFLRLQKSNAFPVEIFESRNERINGTDLEIVIKTEGSYLLFPCQCKIVDKSLMYPTILHKNQNGYQIDALLQYAHKVNGIAIYLLYNNCPNNNINLTLEESWRDKYPVEAFGCSFIDAQYISHRFRSRDKWQIPGFNNLHLGARGALPFEFLAFFYDRNFLKDFKSRFSIFSNFIGTKYADSYLPVIGMDNWKPLVKGATIGNLNPFTSDVSQQSAFANNINHFLPGYRIVFDLDEFFELQYKMQ